MFDMIPEKMDLFSFIVGVLFPFLLAFVLISIGVIGKPGKEEK